MIDANVVIGVSIALAGAVFLNVGKGLEKMKVHVFAQGWAMFRSPHNKDLGVWLLGMSLTFSFGISQWIAMRFVDNPSLITAMNGFGLVALVLFAIKIIGEHITRRELVGIGIIVISTVIMAYFQAPTKAYSDFNTTALVVGALIPLGLFGILSAYALKTGRMWGFAFGGLSGSFNAIPSMLLKISWLIVGHEASVIAQLRHPYLYVALLMGIVATATTQVGFWRDRAIIVVPTFISLNMIVPAVLEYFIFGVSLQLVQYLAMAGVIGGVIFLSLSTPEAVLAVKVEQRATAGKGPPV